MDDTPVFFVQMTRLKIAYRASHLAVPVVDCVEYTPIDIHRCRGTSVVEQAMQRSCHDVIVQQWKRPIVGLIHGGERGTPDGQSQALDQTRQCRHA